MPAGLAKRARRRSSNWATRCSKRRARGCSTSPAARPCLRPRSPAAIRDLLADRRTVTKLGANWQPLEETDLRLRGEYVRTRFDDPVSSFPGVDRRARSCLPRPLRPRRRRPSWSGSTFARSITTAPAATRCASASTSPSRSSRRRPPPAQIEAFRARRQARGRKAPRRPPGDGQRGWRRGAGSAAVAAVAAASGGGQERRPADLLADRHDHPGRRSDDPAGLAQARLSGAATRSARAAGGRATRSRPQAGYFNNGLGARLSANYRTGGRVDSADGESLRFSPLATVDLQAVRQPRPALRPGQPSIRGCAAARCGSSSTTCSTPSPRCATRSARCRSATRPTCSTRWGGRSESRFRKLFLPPRRFFRRDGAAAR